MTVCFPPSRRSSLFRLQYVSYLRVGAEHMALDFIHGVHPVRHGAEVEPPEHHLILGQSSWMKRGRQVEIMKQITDVNIQLLHAA